MANLDVIFGRCFSQNCSLLYPHIFDFNPVTTPTYYLYNKFSFLKALNNMMEPTEIENITEHHPAPEDVSVAVKTFKEALQVERCRFGEAHTKPLTTLHHLAIALRDNDYFEEALECFEDECRILCEKRSKMRMSIGSEKDPDFVKLVMEIASVQTNIGNTYRSMVMPKNAIGSYKSSLRTFKSVGTKKSHPRYAMTRRMLKRLQGKKESRSDVRNDENPRKRRRRNLKQ